LILAGAILTGDGHPVAKSGDLLDEEIELRLRGEPNPFVSRGGLKLAAALDAFQIDPTGQVCLDVGASTGGFTDCLLQRGAERVYAVDVGTNQLAWSLRRDPRVVVIERCNIRHIEPDRIPELCSILVADVSFISLTLALPPALQFAASTCDVVALVKPQFEVGRDEVGKGGVVRDAAARHRALQRIERVFRDLGLATVRSIDSPVAGAKGNLEFLLAGRRSE
jgi:23S rRNA (cytidine1920-2'-O)/16S rRNA (cytidine1409-2'-O)-methyltransferase